MDDSVIDFSDSDFSEFESDDDVPLADLIRNFDDSSDSDGSGSESEDQNNDTWSVNDKTPRPKRPFIGPEPGPTTLLSPDDKEWDFVELFFPVMLIELLVKQTNLYASQKQSRKPDPSWRQVTFVEMKAWLGICVYMSIIQLPQTQMYWSTDKTFGNLSIRKVMKRDRFMKILQYFHVNDRSKMQPRGHPTYDKLFLVRPILDEVRKLCLQNYNAHQNVSVDEAMVKFRGRLSFKQYLPAKPTKYGIKIWVRADPANGYVNDFQVYTGRDGPAENGLAHRVVTELMNGINGRNHIVNMDNYFSSPMLFQELENNGTYARGTVRSNRKGFPHTTLKKKDVKNQGDMKFAQKGELVACIWKDKKEIFTLSTADNPANIDSSVPRKSRTGDIKEVPAPVTIPEYNNYMNGVDHADQLRTAYSTFRTSRKWWLYLFWFLWDTAVVNAFIVMKESPYHKLKTRKGKPKERALIDFRMNVAKQLIADYTENEKASLATVNAGHFPSNGLKRGRCRQCSKRKRRHECFNMCLQCNVHVCVPCFKDWHTDILKNGY
ncbi:piggyBac transposable element-derived protein 4-like [Mercenaria mercenaria]|uniref:piggyBac transposable element-derived protein 4-like n=1 Tax=Mercenaria mercenaria TaxID=6596 RepID=UPI00234F9618|nr:piggyBac transposable element-derived protein 4-like [Mercenaria mercenaria]